MTNKTRGAAPRHLHQQETHFQCVSFNEKDLQNAKTLLYDTNECITNHGYTCSKERFIYPEFQHNGLGLGGTRYKVH